MQARFCFEHGMAEFHGCGTDAKRAARSEFREQQQGHGVFLKPEKRAQLQRKLDKQLEEKAAERQVKKGDGSKK